MNVTNSIFIFLIIGVSTFLIVMVDAGTDVAPNTYISFIDSETGFYKVRSTTTNNMPSYLNHILTINQGDIVSWINDDEKRITLISEQGLWNDEAYLKRYKSQFNYTFNRSGKYVFRMKENSIFHQTIIVKPVDDYPMQTYTTPATITYTPAPTVTKYPTPVPVVTYKVDHTSEPKNQDNILPIKITLKTIASMIVAMIAIFITYRYGKN